MYPFLGGVSMREGVHQTMAPRQRSVRSAIRRCRCQPVPHERMAEGEMERGHFVGPNSDDHPSTLVRSFSRPPVHHFSLQRAFSFSGGALSLSDCSGGAAC